MPGPSLTASLAVLFARMVIMVRAAAPTADCQGTGQLAKTFTSKNFTCHNFEQARKHHEM